VCASARNSVPPRCREMCKAGSRADELCSSAMRIASFAGSRFPRPPDVTVSPHGTSWHLMALPDRTKFSE